MKTKLKFHISTATMLAVLTALTMASPAFGNAAEKKEPLPAARITSPPPPGLDPATGLPLAGAPTESIEWKDPEWKDPDKSLTVSYDGLPVGLVADDLRKQFNDAFDIVIPKAWRPPDGVTSFDPADVSIHIQLKHVTASELFNAFNLMFEAENTPLRWELKMNGQRPTVLLRVLPMALAPSPPPAEQPTRKLFFVGDLLGDEKTVGMTMENLVTSVLQILDISYGNSRGHIIDRLHFHEKTQLLIFTGTIDEIGLVTETLSALRQKTEHNAHVKAAVGGKTGTNASAEKPKAP